MSLNVNNAGKLLLLSGLMLVFLGLGQVLGQETPAAAEADSSGLPEEGFVGDGDSDIDYDALIKELYGKEEKPALAADSVETTTSKRRKPRQAVQGPAPGMFPRSALNGSHLAFNASSPFLVADPLMSWYSFIDAGVTIKLPFEVYVESIPLYLLFEVSTFSFENSYPEGGQFKGLAYIMQASTIGDNSGAAMGFGLWHGIMGSMLELNYRFRPTNNTFFRLGTRGVLVTEVYPLDAAWWIELRLSTGFEF
jgi:hypothetical protein